MKRIAFIMMAILLAVIPSTAQNYKNSRYYNKKTGHLDYRYNHSYGAPYFGFRIGPAFTYVNSDDSRLDGGDWQTGLNVGVVAGIPLTDTAPLYLETGLSYIEKGGKKDLVSGKKMTYDLNYLQIPAVLKYKYDVDDHFSIQPQFGGYFAVGVGGKIKNFAEREAQSSFRSDNFRVWMVVCASVAASATICSMPTSPTTSALQTSATTVLTNRIMEPSCSISE